jgi:hypothetical protein
MREFRQRGDLLTFSKRLGVKVTSKDLADTPSASTADPQPLATDHLRPRIDGHRMTLRRSDESGRHHSNR